LRTKGYDNLTSSESPLKYNIAHEETSNVKTKTFVSVTALNTAREELKCGHCY